MLWRKGHYGGRSETAARNDADYTLVAHGNAWNLSLKKPATAWPCPMTGSLEAQLREADADAQGEADDGQAPAEAKQVASNGAAQAKARAANTRPPLP
jgi:hypothetical protein